MSGRQSGKKKRGRKAVREDEKTGCGGKEGIWGMYLFSFTNAKLFFIILVEILIATHPCQHLVLSDFLTFPHSEHGEVAHSGLNLIYSQLMTLSTFTLNILRESFQEPLQTPRSTDAQALCEMV